MKKIGEGFGGVLILIVIIAGILFLAAFFLGKGIWLSEKFTPTLTHIAGLLLWVLIILLPFTLIKRARGVVGGIMLAFAYFYSFTLWECSFLLTYELWGTLALIIGFLFMGVGFVPMALLATALKGMWSTFWQLAFLLGIFAGSGFLGTYLLHKHEEAKEDKILNAI